MALHQLPTTLPIDDLQYIIAGLIGSGPQDLTQMVASGFAVVEYGTGQVLPAQPVKKLVGPFTQLNRTTLVSCLQDAVTHHGHVSTGHATAVLVDWKIIVQLLIAALQAWLTKGSAP